MISGPLRRRCMNTAPISAALPSRREEIDERVAGAERQEGRTDGDRDERQQGQISERGGAQGHQRTR